MYMVTFDINNKIQKSNFARGAKQKVFNCPSQVTDQKPLPAAARRRTCCLHQHQHQPSTALPIPRLNIMTTQLFFQCHEMAVSDCSTVYSVLMWILFYFKVRNNFTFYVCHFLQLRCLYPHPIIDTIA